MNEETFWVVAKDAPVIRATKRHATPGAALVEAKRLAALEHKPFLLLELVEIVPPPAADAAEGDTEGGLA